MNVVLSTREAERDILNALRGYARHSNRSLPYILEKRGRQLAIGGKGVKGLYQEARSHAPATKAEIRALPKKLDWRIRRPPGRTARQEIAARIKNTGLYQSTGWLTEGFTGIPTGARVITRRGEVHFLRSGLNPRLTLINKSEGAAEFAAKTGYVNRAMKNAAADMRKYVQKKMASDAKAFSKPVKKPTYPSIDAQLNALLRV